MPLRPGQTLSHYRLEKRIGSGGMGVVYLARNLHLDTDVALKVLPDRWLEDGHARRRFEKEARRLSKLNHPNIAIVHDFDRADSVDFIVMEYVPGVTLQERLNEGPLGENDLPRLGLQLTAGLEAAHAEGVVHRDIKPSNLRVMPNGQLKILDFGLAKLLRASETSSTESLSDGAAGTPPYMAPEQFEGRADERTDIYGAGTVLYEMGTGRRPFTETSMPQLMRAILHEPPESPRAVNVHTSVEVELVILKALDKDPARRYQTMREMHVDLERISSPTPSQSSRTIPETRSSGRIVAAAVVVVIGATILIPRLPKRAADAFSKP